MDLYYYPLEEEDSGISLRYFFIVLHCYIQC